MNVLGNLEVEFKSDKEAADVLELVRYANVHTQKPLTKEELIFSTKAVIIATFVFGFSIYLADLAIRGGLDMISYVARLIFG